MSLCPYCGSNSIFSVESQKYGGCCDNCKGEISTWLFVRSKFGVCNQCGRKGGEIEINNQHVAVRCRRCNGYVAIKQKDPELGILLDVIIDRANNKASSDMDDNDDGYDDDDEKVRCPKCSSTQITTGSRGYSLAWGFIGAGKTVNRCANCGYKWEPRG